MAKAERTVAIAASEGEDGDALQVHQKRDLSFYWVCHGCIGLKMREFVLVSLCRSSFGNGKFTGDFVL